MIRLMGKLRLIALLLILASCSAVNQSVMFKTGKGYTYAEFDSTTFSLYRIAVNDIVEFSIYTNDGLKIIDITNSVTSGSQTVFNIQYIVQTDSTIKLPMVGKQKIVGYSLREAEKVLEEKYKANYNDPFVLLKVINRRVFVFPGTGGAGAVISLTNENTTLIEALAKAGGIHAYGKASKIKLVRGDLTNPKVFIIDLSTIQGMTEANLVLQANDIIYVEPNRRISQEILATLTPYLALVTSIIAFISLTSK